ncbi:CRISPR-associated endonuclease Cas1 [Salinarimonas sp. NSM]|uniref:CRISPR-associated endonuclease Cas1 n=1 Tax=Salinarimonas sp. NSM TaxID=3458003 RepID=UPI004035E44F
METPAISTAATHSGASPLFARLCEPATLRAAWAKVQANAGAAGGDGVTVERFAYVADSQIEMLARGLRDGSYRPGPARRVLIPKKGGGERPLDIPCVSDRVVQAAAALVLDPVLDAEMEPSSFAYRRGRSVAQAVARVAALRGRGFDHVVDGDIRAYFETIPHERLISRLERSVDDARLVDLVWLWLECYSLTGRGVPQGSPISPLLANLYLDDVDAAIESRGVRLVRFADDFLLLCRGRPVAEDALERMRDLLAEHGLALHPDKTRIVDFTEGFRFLGHVFVRSLVVQEVGADETPEEDAVAAAEAVLTRAQAQGRDAPDEEDDATAAEGPGRHARGLVPVYVIEPGARLEARRTRLAVVDRLGRVADLPPAAIDRIELGPEADAGLEALDLAAAHGVEVLRVNGHGEVTGRWEPEAPARAALHLAQARLVLDPERRRALAQTLVEAKVRNQRAYLHRLNRERRDPEIAAILVQLSRLVRRFRAPMAIDEAMGREGEAAALYWRGLARCLPPAFALSRRRRRERRDPVNLLLDVAASRLAREVRSQALRVGLHLGFGVLHETREGHDALVHDLMEEFRQPLAEAFVLAAIARGQIRPEHVRRDGEAVALTREGWAALLRAWEGWVARPIAAPNGERMLWRRLILHQAHAFARHALEGAPYVPYVMDY